MATGFPGFPLPFAREIEGRYWRPNGLAPPIPPGSAHPPSAGNRRDARWERYRLIHRRSSTANQSTYDFNGCVLESIGSTLTVGLHTGFSACLRRGSRVGMLWMCEAEHEQPSLLAPRLDVRESFLGLVGRHAVSLIGSAAVYSIGGAIATGVAGPGLAHAHSYQGGCPTGLQ